MMEAAFKTATERIKDVLAFLDKVSVKKNLRKDKEDLVVALRVFLQTTEHLLPKRCDSTNSDGQVYDDVTLADADKQQDYIDVETQDIDQHSNQHTIPPNEDEGDGIYEDNVLEEEEIKQSSPNKAISIPPTACEDLVDATMGDFLEAKREKNLLRGAWQKRWCVIQGAALFMYENSSDKKQKDAIDVSGCLVTVGSSKEAKRKDRCFDIKLPQSNKTYEFCATDKESVAKWVRGFEIASNAVLNFPKRLSTPDNTLAAAVSPSHGPKKVFGLRVSKYKQEKKPVSGIKSKFTSTSSSDLTATDDDGAVYQDTAEVNGAAGDIYMDTMEPQDVYLDADSGPPALPPPLTESDPVVIRTLPPTPDDLNPPSLPGKYDDSQSTEAIPQVPPRPNKAIKALPSTPIIHSDEASGNGSFDPKTTLPPTPTDNPGFQLPPIPSKGEENEIENEDEEFKEEDSMDLYQGMWDCIADEDNELSFKRGQIVHITSREYDHYGWWIAKRKGQIGFVPKDYLIEAYEI